MVATVHLFIAGSGLKLLAHSVSIALSTSAMAQTDRGNEFSFLYNPVSHCLSPCPLKMWCILFFSLSVSTVTF